MTTPVDPPADQPPPEELPWAIKTPQRTGLHGGHCKVVVVRVLALLLVVAVFMCWYIAEGPRRQAQAAFPDNPAAAAIYEWELDGGREQVESVNAATQILVASPLRFELAPACDQLADDAYSASTFRPIPDTIAQQHWSAALYWTEMTAAACSSATRTGSRVSAMFMRLYAGRSVAENTKLGERFAAVREGG